MARTRTILLLLSGLVLAGCTTIIIPPADPDEPVEVFLIDYGRHTSLLLPDAEGRALREYAYGDWNWYALDRSSALDVLPTLFWPTRGTLGRRDWTSQASAEALRRRIACEDILSITVSRHAVTDLRRRLHARSERRRDTMRHSTLYGLDFVQDDEAYHLLHNCNQVTATWLQALGCEVRGCAILADFAVHAPPTQ